MSGTMSALIIRQIVIAAIFGMMFLIWKTWRDRRRAKRLADGAMQSRFLSGFSLLLSLLSLMIGLTSLGPAPRCDCVPAGRSRCIR